MFMIFVLMILTDNDTRETLSPPLRLRRCRRSARAMRSSSFDKRRILRYYRATHELLVMYCNSCVCLYTPHLGCCFVGNLSLSLDIREVRGIM